MQNQKGQSIDLFTNEVDQIYSSSIRKDIFVLMNLRPKSSFRPCPNNENEEKKPVLTSIY
ncbi:hypothetical protein [Peribacillus butanolivorans]|uniref:hypothetical protein n=1 Tax=Peribacillus butanolivorans TaxID=421767 RepID=UPI001596F8B8|nr:hypothetical protein [Peribacillus butanolivorans]